MYVAKHSPSVDGLYKSCCISDCPASLFKSTEANSNSDSISKVVYSVIRYKIQFPPLFSNGESP